MWMSAPIHWLSFLLICLYIQYLSSPHGKEDASTEADYLAHFHANSFSLPPTIYALPQGGLHEEASA